MADEEKEGGVGVGMRRIVKDKKSKRFLLIVGGVVFVGFAYSLLGGHKTNTNTNTVQDSFRDAPKVQGGDVGGIAPPEQYKKILKEQDNSNIQRAKATGASATPSLVMQQKQASAPLTLGDGNEHGSTDNTPLPQDNVGPQANALDNPMPDAPIQTPAQVQVTPQQVDPNAVNAMVQRLSLMRNTQLPGLAVKTMYMVDDKTASAQQVHDTPDHNNALLSMNSVGGNAALSSGVASSSSAPHFSVPVAGTIIPSLLLGAVNSDIDSPVIAEISEGAFAGSRLLGNFSFTEQGLILHFKSMTVPYTNDDGEKASEVVAIDAIGVDKDTLSGGMASTIDRHLLVRVGVQFASAFLQGMGQAVAQSGATAVVSPYGGTTVSNPQLSLKNQLLMASGTGASQASNIFQSTFGNQRTTIKIKQHVPFGLLFLDSGK